MEPGQSVVERVATILAAVLFGVVLSVVCAAIAGAADCPEQGDLTRRRLDWGQPCSKATGSCEEPYRCLWPPDCRCDVQPLGMQRDPQRQGWQKGAPVAQGPK